MSSRLPVRVKVDLHQVHVALPALVLLLPILFSPVSGKLVRWRYKLDDRDHAASSREIDDLDVPLPYRLRFLAARNEFAPEQWLQRSFRQENQAPMHVQPVTSRYGSMPGKGLFIVGSDGQV